MKIEILKLNEQKKRVKVLIDGKPGYMSIRKLRQIQDAEIKREDEEKKKLQPKVEEFAFVKPDGQVEVIKRGRKPKNV